MKTKSFEFSVPEQKKIRLIINTDAKNEADDQYAIVHALLTPKFKVKGIIGSHFGTERSKNSMQESCEEVKLVLKLMGLENPGPVWQGAATAVGSDAAMLRSEGSDEIIKEALKDDPLPLYAIFLGPLTDLAVAVCKEPAICSRMTAIWIGGGPWPDGGAEFNLQNDAAAANIIFQSDMPLWQIPRNVYNQIKVSLAELQLKVHGYGKIGEYLFRQMVDFNNQSANNQGWPLGESWVLGDSAAIGVLLDPHEFDFTVKPAPDLDNHMCYNHSGNNRPIRVYNTVDVRFILEDFFAKLQLCYPEAGS